MEFLTINNSHRPLAAIFAPSARFAESNALPVPVAANGAAAAPLQSENHWQSLKRVFLLSLMIYVCAVMAHAQTFSGWGNSYEYDQGWNPSVAIAGSTVVEVHNGQGAAGPMWYHVGQTVNSGINWGQSYEYDQGYNPSVAMYGNTVVEVHNGQGSAGPMWYHVGKVSGSSIAWGPSYKYDSGWNPSVSLTSCATSSNPNCGLIAIEVHNGQGSAGPMWYHVGRVTGSTIAWKGSYRYDSGYNPQVAAQLCLTDEDAFCGITVIEVHNGQGSAGPMWYHVGTWTSGSSISWGPSYDYDWGWNPRVAFFDGAYVMEVHDGNDVPGAMWYHYGAWLGGTTLDLGNSSQYDSGWNPSVAADYGVAVEVHNGQGEAGPMWYHWGTFSYPQ